VDIALPHGGEDAFGEVLKVFAESSYQPKVIPENTPIAKAVV
jgi:hypothetical protein